MCVCARALGVCGCMQGVCGLGSLRTLLCGYRAWELGGQCVGRRRVRALSAGPMNMVGVL